MKYKTGLIIFFVMMQSCFFVTASSSKSVEKKCIPGGLLWTVLSSQGLENNYTDELSVPNLSTDFSGFSELTCSGSTATATSSTVFPYLREKETSSFDSEQKSLMRKKDKTFKSDSFNAYFKQPAPKIASKEKKRITVAMLAAKIDSLEKSLKSVEKQNEDLKKRLDALEHRN